MQSVFNCATTVFAVKAILKDKLRLFRVIQTIGNDVVEALDSVNEREATPNLDELKRLCNEVMNFYDEFSIKSVRPFGDMIRLHGEVLPASKRCMNDYIQHVTRIFLAGFGAAQG